MATGLPWQEYSEIRSVLLRKTAVLGILGIRKFDARLVWNIPGPRLGICALVSHERAASSMAVALSKSKLPRRMFKKLISSNS